MCDYQAMRTAELTQGAVESRDGTTIGYWKTGQGPAVVVLHGSMESARSHTLLAAALADDFTVYLLDRRGRGGAGGSGVARRPAGRERLAGLRALRGGRR